MCRADVAEAAQAPLARVLHEMRDALAAQEGVRPEDIQIGPVDFGPEDSREA